MARCAYAKHAKRASPQRFVYLYMAFTIEKIEITLQMENFSSIKTFLAETKSMLPKARKASKGLSGNSIICKNGLFGITLKLRLGVYHTFPTRAREKHVLPYPCSTLRVRARRFWT